jgi:hypothetical protein
MACLIARLGAVVFVFVANENEIDECDVVD